MNTENLSVGLLWGASQGRFRFLVGSGFRGEGFAHSLGPSSGEIRACVGRQFGLSWGRIQAFVGRVRAFVGKDSGFRAEGFLLSWSGIQAFGGKIRAFVGKDSTSRGKGFGLSWEGIRSR